MNIILKIFLFMWFIIIFGFFVGLIFMLCGIRYYWKMAVTTIVDNVFKIFSEIKGILWEVIKKPFEWWFSLPKWLHLNCFALLCLIGLCLGLWIYRNRNLWRYRYTLWIYQSYNYQGNYKAYSHCIFLQLFHLPAFHNTWQKWKHHIRNRQS